MEDLVNENLFSGIYQGKRVLVTGHTGFKGAWLCFWLHKMGAMVTGLSLNELTSPSHFENLGLNIKSFYGDIKDLSSVEEAFQAAEPEIVFHLAAQSLVRDSYRNPLLTYSTNVMGTLNIFEVARKTPSVKVIVNVTTDKVYENLEQATAFEETDKLGGHDMYSSSKACSEILTSSYRKSFLNDNKILLASARAGNVIGGGDWANDRLIPDIIRAVKNKAATEIRSPKSIRPWEHVLEPLSGYLLLGQKLLEGKNEFATSWNFGPDNKNSLQVIEVIKLIQAQWKEMEYFINEEEAKKFHEAGVLKLNCSKALNEMGWKPVWDINTTINKTVNWYKEYYEGDNLRTELDLLSYISDAKQKSLTWTC